MADEHRALVIKEPTVLNFDMKSSIPRKLGDLANMFVLYAEANEDDTATMMVQVRVYTFRALNPPPVHACFLKLQYLNHG